VLCAIQRLEDDEFARRARLFDVTDKNRRSVKDMRQNNHGSRREIAH
jgi:hypothetical protein